MFEKCVLIAGSEPNFVKIQKIQNLLGNERMSEVGGIEAASDMMLRGDFIVGAQFIASL